MKPHPADVKKNTGRRLTPKKPWRSPKYRAHVRTFPCLVCGRNADEAHHLRIGLRTMGVRKEDRRCVPLCAAHHDILHKVREETFWNYYQINPLGWCERTHAAWLTTTGKAPA